MLTLQPVATILVIYIVRYKRALEIQLKKLGAEHVNQPVTSVLVIYITRWAKQIRQKTTISMH